MDNMGDSSTRSMAPSIGWSLKAQVFKMRELENEFHDKPIGFVRGIERE